MTDLLAPPDLIIYLKASVSTLQKRIALRGRDFESKIESEYLQNLNNLYDEFVENFDLCPVLTIPADNIDFVKYPDQMEMITEAIKKKLSGKETLQFPPK